MKTKILRFLNPNIIINRNAVQWIAYYSGINALHVGLSGDDFYQIPVTELISQVNSLVGDEEEYLSITSPFPVSTSNWIYFNDVHLPFFKSSPDFILFKKEIICSIVKDEDASPEEDEATSSLTIMTSSNCMRTIDVYNYDFKRMMDLIQTS